MKILLLFVFPVLLLVLLAVIKKKSGTAQGASAATLRAQPVLTLNEQPLYWRLVEALGSRDSGHIVLAQVSFLALAAAAGGNRSQNASLRGRVAQKRVDFVICRKDFSVVAVIELDDASHKGRAQQDAERDQLLASAGIRTIRYPRIPSADQLRADILRVTPPLPKQLQSA